MKKLLSFLALALCFVACQNELGTEVSNSDFVDVVLTVDAPELGVTRADNDGQNEKNSALGAIDFLSDADWANYDLRYILEVYAADDDGTGEPIYRERLVNCLDKYAPTTFALRLVPNRDYKFVVFSDFVAEGNAELTEPAEKLAISDLYYNTADLRNISAITTQPTWGAMNEIRDAYFIAENVTISTGLNMTLTLKRPFAKLRVIAQDLDYITGYSQPGYVEVTYKNEKIYKSFNAVNGELNADEMAGDELKYGYNVSKAIPYNAGYDAYSTNQTLFTDYLFAVEGEQTPVNFEMAVYESKGGRLIHSQDFNTQIPIQRNHLTTILGDLLTTQANITIEVNDNFEDEFVNSTMTPALLAPKAVGEPKVEGNVITIEWEAVEGADNYSVLVNNEIPVFVEETNYTFVGEYETSYTIQVTAIPADETAYTHSDATVFTVTTGEKPEAYKLYFNNVSEWAKVYAHIWANEGEDLGLEASEWPGRELTETETLDGVTYYVFQLPAEATGKTVNVVFNDGAGAQTKDLAGVATENLFFDNYVEPVAPSDVVLYLKPNANWKIDNARFAAYFFNNGETWVDMTLVEGETNIYAVTVPAGFVDIIFCRMNPAVAANNWNNKWNQTADLKVPTDGTNLYTVKENTWDNGGGTWSVYTPVVEPTALATPVVTSVVEGNVVTLTWESVENAAQYGITVGTEMPVFVEDTTYVFTGEYETEYTFNVVAVPADEVKFAVSEAAVVTAKTEAEPVVYTTVAEFLAAEEDDTIYTLNGTITSVTQTTYGNFYLMDDTGEVLIYGLCSPEGAQKYWAESGAKVGDDITVKTVRTSYGGSPQGKNAIFVDLVSPGTRAFWSFSKTATTFTSVGGQEVITVDAYNLTDDITVASDNVQFSAKYADGQLTISAVENTTTETINGNITVTSGALEQVITVAQGGASVGGGTEVVAEATMKSFGWANSAGVSEAKIDENVTVKFFQGGASTAPAYYTSGEAVRLYQNGAYMTVSANGKTIKSMEITFGSNMYYVAADSGELTEEAATRTWTGDATEVKITCTGTDKNHRAYIAAIKVTYID